MQKEATGAYSRSSKAFSQMAPKTGSFSGFHLYDGTLENNVFFFLEYMVIHKLRRRNSNPFSHSPLPWNSGS